MLPKIDVPIFEVELVSTKKKIKFRPFLVKEQKLFLMASQSENISDVVDSIKQVLNNCVLTENFNVNELPLFELEYLFMQLRARSVGEIVELNYKCNNTTVDENGNEKKCNGVVPVQLNVLEVKPTTPEGHDKTIQITESLGVVMKYPTFGILENFKGGEEVDFIELIASCVDYIYDNDQMFYAKDTPKEELKEFIENLQQSDYEKIKRFFETLPKNEKSFDFKCPKCGYHEVISVEGIQNFFG